MVAASTLFLKRPNTSSSTTAAVAAVAAPAKIVLLTDSEVAAMREHNEEAAEKAVHNSKKRKKNMKSSEKLSRKAAKIAEKIPTGKGSEEAHHENFDEIFPDSDKEDNNGNNNRLNAEMAAKNFDDDIFPDSDKEDNNGNNRLNAEMAAENLQSKEVVIEGTDGGEMETTVVRESVVYHTYDDKLSIFVVDENTSLEDLVAQFTASAEVETQLYADAHNKLVQYVTSYIYAAVIVKQRLHEEAVNEREKKKKNLLGQKNQGVAAPELAKIRNEESLVEENSKMPLMKILDEIVKESKPQLSLTFTRYFGQYAIRVDNERCVLFLHWLFASVGIYSSHQKRWLLYAK